MTLFNADGGIAEMSGNGMRCLAWVAARAGLGDARPAGRRHRGRAPHRRPSTSTPRRAGCRRATVDMGPVTFDPAAIPLDAPSARSTSRPRTTARTYRGRRRRHRQPALRAPSSTTSTTARGHPARAAPRARPALPEPHERRVRRAGPRAGRHRDARLGTRRRRDVVVRHRRVRGGRGRAPPRARRRARRRARPRRRPRR